MKASPDLPLRDPMRLLMRVWPPMLATLSEGASLDPRSHLFEEKYDGFRALAAVSDHRATLQSRNGLDFAARFPSLVRALRELDVQDAVLDGEIVALDNRGVASFQRLQREGMDVTWFVFDLLWFGGQDLRSRPIEERRALLEGIFPAARDRADFSSRKSVRARRAIELARRINGGEAQALESARRSGAEGLIAKRRGSRYSGGRSREWLKLKIVRAQELAVIGFTPIANGARAIGALHVGYREGGAWTWAGKVGSGYTDSARARLFADLLKDRRVGSVAKNAPRAKESIWVEPRLVAQVRFSEWTDDGRLRHPVFEGLRDDKRPEDATRETGAASAVDPAFR